MHKVLFILPNLEPGGAERATITILQNLNNKNFFPTLFLVRNNGALLKEVPPWVKVVTALRPKQNFFLFFPYLVLLFLKTAFKNDIYFGCLERTPTYLAYFAGKFFRRPAIGWFHVNFSLFDSPLFSSKFHNLLSELIYPKLNKVIVVSKGVSDSVFRKFPKIRKLNVEIIYNPVPIEFIVDKSKESTPFVSEECPVIIGVGRLSFQKRFDLLIRAHSILLRQGIKQKLLILGEGPERVALIKLIQSLSLEDSVKLLGHQPNPYNFMRIAKTFVLSSDFEGLPTVLIEALALGLPVIATDCPSGPREILSDGKYGVLVSRNSQEDLAAAIREILINEELTKNLISIGPTRAEQFDPKNTIPLLERALEKVLIEYRHGSEA